MKPVVGSSRSLRICRIVTVPFIFETLLRDQLGYMTQQGMDVSLVSSPGAALEGVCRSLGIRYHPVRMVRQPRPGRDLCSLLSLTKLFLRERFDIVHSTAPKAGLLTALAGALSGLCSSVLLMVLGTRPPYRWVHRPRVISGVPADPGSRTTFSAGRRHVRRGPSGDRLG